MACGVTSGERVVVWGRNTSDLAADPARRRLFRGDPRDREPGRCRTRSSSSSSAQSGAVVAVRRAASRSDAPPCWTGWPRRASGDDLRTVVTLPRADVDGVRGPALGDLPRRGARRRRVGARSGRRSRATRRRDDDPVHLGDDRFPEGRPAHPPRHAPERGRGRWQPAPRPGRPDLSRRAVPSLLRRGHGDAGGDHLRRDARAARPTASMRARRCAPSPRSAARSSTACRRCSPRSSIIRRARRRI